MLQLVTLAALAGTVGLAAVGLLAGLGYAAVLTLVLSWALARRAASSGGPVPGARLAPADRVTLARAVLIGGITALVVGPADRLAVVPVLVGLTVPALLLDGVDGWVARRTGTAAPLGARFDMELDAYLLLVLSVQVARSAGWWVLLIGAARYLYGIAGAVLPWLAVRLPARYWRKVVTAVQGIALTLAASGLLPVLVGDLALVAALALLAESFGRDVWWCWRRRRQPVTTRPALLAAGGGARRVG